MNRATAPAPGDPHRPPPGFYGAVAYYFHRPDRGRPVAITLYLTWWFVTWSTIGCGRLPRRLSAGNLSAVPCAGLRPGRRVIALTLLGFLAANIAGRTLVALGEAMLDRMPVVRGDLREPQAGVRDDVLEGGTSFAGSGWSNFPAGEMVDRVDLLASAAIANACRPEEHISVFLPCAPNPTTGFFFFVPAKQVIEVAMTPRTPRKLVMSAGLIQPPATRRSGARQIEARAGPGR